MTVDLSEIWMGLDKAESHRQTLEESARLFFSKEPYSIEVQLNPDTKQRDFIFRVTESVRHERGGRDHVGEPS